MLEYIYFRIHNRQLSKTVVTPTFINPTTPHPYICTSHHLEITLLRLQLGQLTGSKSLGVFTRRFVNPPTRPRHVIETRIESTSKYISEKFLSK